MRGEFVEEKFRMDTDEKELGYETFGLWSEESCGTVEEYGRRYLRPIGGRLSCYKIPQHGWNQKYRETRMESSF